MSGFVYIIRSQKSGRTYIGSTGDFDRRLQQHNANAVTATRGKGPWVPAALVAWPTTTEARQAENYLKEQKSRLSIEQVIAGTFRWPTAHPTDL
jgi:putative endonuclease